MSSRSTVASMPETTLIARRKTTLIAIGEPESTTSAFWYGAVPHWYSGKCPHLADHPPPAWFLPGTIRIRGGAAWDFSSVWPFHRGIHPESTCAGSAEISTHFQGLAQPALRERWIPVGIHGIHPEESRDRGSHSRKPPSPRRPEGIDSTSKNRLTKLPPLTYPLIIEELRSEDTLSGVSFS